MKVSEAMTRNVCVASLEETIQKAAQLMRGLDIGALPVGHENRLVGMITDRDIAVRGVAEGRVPDARVGEVMTTDIRFCYDDQDIDDVCRNMGEIKVRRLPVISRDKRLVGILSLGDIAVSDGGGKAGEALSGISKPGGEHSQTA